MKTQQESLDQIGTKYRTDKSSKFHNYLTTYDKWFDPFREDNIKFLEIGIGNKESWNHEGESLYIWRDYFKNGMIYGIDIDDKSFMNEERIKTFQGDQIDVDFLKGVGKEVGKFDVIVDDALHVNDMTLITFEVMFPYLLNGGIYIIEDCHTNYWKSCRGTPDIFDWEANTVMNYFFKVAHGITISQTINQEPIPYQVPELHKHIESVHFYKSLIFIAKK